MNCDEDNSFIEDDVYRSAQQIAKRSIVLNALISVIYGESLLEVIDWLKKENLWGEVTPNEQAFINNPNDERAQINLSWKSEALAVLLWSINKFPNITKLDSTTGINDLKEFVVNRPMATTEFIETAKLLSEDEIEEEYEVVFESHWAVRDARIKKKAPPKNIDSGVVMEKQFPDGLHYLNSWVNSEKNICFQLMESNDESLFYEWFKIWENFVDFELYPLD